MADWRQIQARIRKAKNSPEALAKLTELFQRTRDAMVAWELGAIQEKAELKDEAARWYAIAAQRFRRADWKQKAEAALTRLGVEVPPPGSAPLEPSESMSPSTVVSAVGREDAEEELTESDDSGESEQPLAAETEESSEVAEIGNRMGSGTETGNAAEAGQQGRRRRRRGRRGGRGRHKGGISGSQLPSQVFAGPAESQSTQTPSRPAAWQASTSTPAQVPAAAPGDNQLGAPAAAGPSAGQTSGAELPGSQSLLARATHGRAGNPALASRMAQLESILRRLLGSPLHRLDEVEEAPAGPGVFLLSDSDQTTMYYVEACQTLRIGLANLGRGGRSGKNRPGGRHESDLKAKLAEYLGVNEAKVSQYIKEHCVVRWIQLDDDASHLAHFAIGVLRTPINLD
jgi:hypothetical protein